MRWLCWLRWLCWMSLASGCVESVLDPAHPGGIDASGVVAGISGNSWSSGISPLDTGAADAPVEPGNILIVLVDDLGVDKLGLYQVHPEVASTPVIDALAAHGVTFTHAYANPLCSPSRAVLQTGRRAWRTGVGSALHVHGNSLDESEITLAEMVREGSQGAYSTSFVGKWHLGSHRQDYVNNPNNQGWQHYSGTLSGIGNGVTLDHQPQTYTDWEKTVNGVVARRNVYMTTDNADDAIARIEAMPEPWLMVVSFFAPHAPYHLPPRSLLTSSEWSGSTPEAWTFNRMIEAVDTELGRVIRALGGASMGTTVVLAGDNGTPMDRLEPELPWGKGSPYEGGVRIPLIVAGPEVRVPGSVSPALVELSDLFATVAELAGVELDEGLQLDAISFLEQLRDPGAPSARAYAYSERFSGDDEVGYSEVALTVRDERYRLVRMEGEDALYDLGDDHVEGPDLLAEAAPSAGVLSAYRSLTAQLPSYWRAWGY